MNQRFTTDEGAGAKRSRFFVVARTRLGVRFMRRESAP